jgi:lysozyme
MRTLNNERLRKLLTNLQIIAMIGGMVYLFITCNSIHSDRLKSENSKNSQVIDPELLEENYDLTEESEIDLYKDMALEVIKKSEGFKNHWYVCPAGKRTIGYGFTNIKWNGTMSKSTAEKILHEEYLSTREAVKKLIRNPKVEERHLAALTSFAYNVGLGSFKRSKILRYINEGEFDKAKNELPKWVYIKTPKSKKLIKGLLKRRLKELNLWDKELS